MFERFFGGKVNCAKTDIGKFCGSKRNRLILLAVVASVCVLAFSGTGKGEAKEKETERSSMSTENISAYTRENEKHLCEVLTKISGAGKVEAMLTYDFTREKILAQNTNSQSSENCETEKTATVSESEKTVFTYGSGNSEEPYVTKEKMPQVAGVLIVAEGASDENVRLEIYEAVKALYGVSGHRVKISAYAASGEK